MGVSVCKLAPVVWLVPQSAWKFEEQPACDVDAVFAANLAPLGAEQQPQIGCFGQLSW